MSSPKRVLIAGAGVAAFEAALALRAVAGDRVDVELVAPETRFWYRPLAVAEPFGLGDVTSFDLPLLAAEAGAQFTPGEVVAVDAVAHVAHTAAGAEIAYDVLLVATGASPRTAVAGALTFRGPADTDLIKKLLGELDRGDVRRLAVVVPSGAVWALPAYELALLIGAYAAKRRIEDVEIVLVTPEDEPLQLFGSTASAAAKKVLDERGITLVRRAHASEANDGQLLRLIPEAAIAVDRVLALPRLYGLPIDGIPQTRDGFIVVDEHSRPSGFRHVFAAGDITSFPVKQGGIAAQQADAAAEAIAVDLGVLAKPAPFRPVLRGVLLTGDSPRYLRHEAGDGPSGTSAASLEPLWWPPAKIVGRHLAPFLARLTGSEPEPATAPAGAVSVDIELRPDDVARREAGRRARRIAGEETTDDRDAQTVGEIMSSEVLVVAPEDTLGEIAERMRAHGVGSALVSDFGHLIGILTSRDLLGAFAGRVHSSEARARQWMTSDPIVVDAATPLTAAMQLMASHDIHHLPVVERDRPVGMVGARQVARAVTELARTRTSVGLGF